MEEIIKELIISETCLQHLLDINSALPSIETRGDSTLTIAKIRTVLDAVVKTIIKENDIGEGQ